MSGSESSKDADLIAGFPEKISRKYKFSEIMEANAHNKEAAAEEARADVFGILSAYKGRVPNEKLAQALIRFEEKHPHGEDLDKSMGALVYGLANELFACLREDIFGDLDPSLISIIKEMADNFSVTAQPSQEIDFILDVAKLISGLDRDSKIAAITSVLRHFKNNSADDKEFIRIIKDVVKAAKKGGMKK